MEELFLAHPLSLPHGALMAIGSFWLHLPYVGIVGPNLTIYLKPVKC